MFIYFFIIICCAAQVSDPVAAEFSLNTQMYLLSKRELWLSDGSMGFGEGSDAAFTEGTKLSPTGGKKHYTRLTILFMKSILFLSRFIKAPPSTAV